MSVQLPFVAQPLLDEKTGRINAAWYLALLNLSNTVTGALVSSVNLAGNNGITVAGGPITSSGVITLGIGNLTCASAVISGTVTAANVVATTSISAANIAASGTINTANEIATGTITAANIVAAASLQSVNLTVSTVNAVNMAATGTVTSARAIITSTITASAVVATASVTAVSLIATGTVTAANVVSTQTVASVGITATGRIEPSSTIGILGTVTNDDANPGSIGEYKSSQVLVAAQVSLATGTATDVTSLALSAGDWDVWGSVGLSTSAATVATNFGAWSSVTSASLPTAPNFGAESFFNLTFATGTASIIPAGRKRFPLSATTTVVLSTYCVFSSGGAAAYGFLGARRAR